MFKLKGVQLDVFDRIHEMTSESRVVLCVLCCVCCVVCVVLCVLCCVCCVVCVVLCVLSEVTNGVCVCSRPERQGKWQSILGSLTVRLKPLSDALQSGCFFYSIFASHLVIFILISVHHFNIKMKVK